MNKIYKCSICGNVVELIHDGGAELVCCGQPMELLTEKTEDQGREKHIPVIINDADGIIIKVGEIPHPMEESHYIEWIELIAEKGNFRKFLKPGNAPEAKFEIKEAVISARIYCNIHGLWKNK